MRSPVTGWSSLSAKGRHFRFERVEYSRGQRLIVDRIPGLAAWRFKIWPLLGPCRCLAFGEPFPGPHQARAAARKASTALWKAKR